jgi:hypothetical protein
LDFAFWTLLNAASSYKPGLLKIIIGSQHFPEAVFGASISAVVIGMMQFHEGLELNLDFVGGCILVKVERMKMLHGPLKNDAALRLGGVGCRAAFASNRL